MGCTPSNQNTITPSIINESVGEYEGKVDKKEISYGLEFINNVGGEDVIIYFVDNGQEIEAKTIENGQKWYINSKKVGLQYKCKMPNGHLIGSFTSQIGFRSHKLTFQQPLAVATARMEYQSWFTFFNSSPNSIKLIWVQMPGQPPISPVLVQPGVLFQVQTSYGQQFMVLRAIDNMYMFSAMASLVLVQKVWSVVKVKKDLEEKQKVTVKGDEADKYGCEKHYTRKDVNLIWWQDLEFGVFLTLDLLLSLEDFEDCYIPPVTVPEIPEGMSCEIKDLFNNAGEMIGSWDINMPYIDIEGADGNVGDAFEGALENRDMDGLRDGVTGAVDGAGEAAGDVLEVPGAAAEEAVDGAGEAAGDVLEVPGAAAEEAVSSFSPAQLKESAQEMIKTPTNQNKIWIAPPIDNIDIGKLGEEAAEYIGAKIEAAQKKMGEMAEGIEMPDMPDIDK